MNAGDGTMAADYPQTRTFELGNGVILEMVLIPAGTFMMGSQESEAGRYSDETQHEVTISNTLANTRLRRPSGSR